MPLKFCQLNLWIVNFYPKSYPVWQFASILSYIYMCGSGSVFGRRIRIQYGSGFTTLVKIQTEVPVPYIRDSELKLCLLAAISADPYIAILAVLGEEA